MDLNHGKKAKWVSTITEIISKYHSISIQEKHHRFKSWEHCYTFFSNCYKDLKDHAVFDHACLHLAFYLASWGMLRGSSFLLQKDYKIHTYFLQDVVLNPVNGQYFETNHSFIESEVITGMNSLIESTKKSYTGKIQVIHGEKADIHVTDTLASKILLGVFGNVPAYDRYFKDAIHIFGIRVQFDEESLKELADFYNRYRDEFDYCRKLFIHDDVHYTPMKLIDMFFWQTGFMLDNKEFYNDEINRIITFANDYKMMKRNQFRHVKPQPHNTNKGLNHVGQTDKIRKFIIHTLNEAKSEGKPYLELRSGDIHKELGLQNRMPSVCYAMESINLYKYTILNNTPSGKSSTKVVRYYL